MTDPTVIAPTAHVDPATVDVNRAGVARLTNIFAEKPVAVIGAVIFALILLVAIFAPVIAPHDPLQQNLGDNFKPPVWKEGGEWRYPIGTDPLGRDLLSRLIYGARNSL